MTYLDNTEVHGGSIKQFSHPRRLYPGGSPRRLQVKMFSWVGDDIRATHIHVSYEEAHNPFWDAKEQKWRYCADDVEGRGQKFSTKFDYLDDALTYVETTLPNQFPDHAIRVDDKIDRSLHTMRPVRDSSAHEWLVGREEHVVDLLIQQQDNRGAGGVIEWVIGKELTAAHTRKIKLGAEDLRREITAIYEKRVKPEEVGEVVAPATASRSLAGEAPKYVPKPKYKSDYKDEVILPVSLHADYGRNMRPGYARLKEGPIDILEDKPDGTEVVVGQIFLLGGSQEIHILNPDGTTARVWELNLRDIFPAVLEADRQREMKLAQV